MKTSKNPFQTVGMRLFLTFFISIVAFVSIVGYLALQTSKDIIQEQVSVQSHQTFILAREKLDMVYDKYEELSMIFILNRELQDTFREYMSTDRDSFDRLQIHNTLNDRMQQFLFTDSMLRGITIFNADGSILFKHNNNIANDYNAEDEEWFQTSVNNGGAVDWRNKYNAEPLSDNSVGLTRLLRSTTASAQIGVLLLEINLDAFANQLAQIDMGETGNTMMIDEQGIIIHSLFQEQLGETTDIDFNLGQDSNTNSDRYIGLNSEGVERLVVFDRPANYSGWYVAGTVDSAELVAGAKGISDITLIMVVLAAVLAILIGYILSRVFGRPLVNLRNLMQQGEQGDLSVRTNIKSKDEIGQLSESFNRMMEQISSLVQQTNHSAQEVLRTAAQLSDVSQKTAMSAKEISVATEQIAGGASTLAVEAERGNELTINIKVEMDRVVESNFEMGNSASEVRNVSEQGIEYMSQLITKTNASEHMTRSMTEKVDNLRESTTSIRQILDVLNKMTKQTNILSLNATIEAARAGAAGKGFMVVADEIRKLADQSKDSIEIVGQITDKIQSEIDETVSVMSEAYPMFKEQVDSVGEADLIFKSVHGQMGDFIQHLDGVTNSIQQLQNSQTVLSEAMSSVSSVSQESSATSEEVASLSSEQLNVSEGLVDLSVQLETLSKTLEESLSKFNT